MEFASLRSRPESWLALLILAQLVVWTLIPWLFASSLPLDVVSDGLAWGHEWQWGYYKHPPLPSWAAELFFDSLGSIGPLLLSQIAIVSTYLFVFLLGRAFMPARWAAVGALLLAGVYYFSIPTPEFNHNVAQMPLWAAASFAYYKAWNTSARRWWIALGAAAGLGLLAKYSTALLLAAILAHFLCTRSARSAFRSAGPYLSLAVAIGIVSPHLVWLVRNGFPTLHYAIGRAGSVSGVAGRVLPPLKFAAAQAIDIAPALAAAAIAGLADWSRPPRSRDENLRFLLWLTLLPPGLTIALSLGTGLGVRDMWGTPMWNLAGLVVVQAARSRWQGVSLAKLGVLLAGLFVAGQIGYLLTNVWIPEIRNRPSRIQWPDRALSQTFAALWYEKTHHPLAIVAADGWLGGLVAMDAAPRPSVWIDADFAKSPWITPGRVAREGALVLWRVRAGRSPPGGLATIPRLRVLGEKSFAWPCTPNADALRIGYGIVPPETVPKT